MLAYDSQCDRLILFGGYNTSELGDTWAFDYRTNTWTNMHPSGGPPRLVWHGMVYDSHADRVILYGGMLDRTVGVYSWDTWSYDYATNTWTNMQPSGRPRGADGPVMAYDSQSDRVILFGGYSAAQTSNDTWAYDYQANAWTNMSPAGSPSARFGQGMAYDSQADRVILFGGTYNSRWPYGPGSAGTDTWAYDYDTNTWTNMAPATKPTARDGPGMDYDPVTNQVILFGGLDTRPWYLNDTWSYRFDSNTWSLVGSVPAPSPRWYPTMAYDSGAGRFVLFGGQTTVWPSGETWAYRTAPGSPSPPGVLASEPGDSQIHLTWQSPADDGGAAIANYSVYRGTASGGESLLAQLGNVLSCTDTGLTNGATYYYQVTATNVLGEGARSTEVSAVPAAPPPDTTPPTITIAEPANNTAAGYLTWTITGTASDDVAVAKVEVSAGGTTWIMATGTTSWTATLTLVPGGNDIYVRATDTSGNVAVSTLHVEVDVPPALAIWFWPMVWTAAAGAAVVAYLGLRRRKKLAARIEPPSP